MALKDRFEQTTLKNISFRAICTGAIVALGLTFLFNLLTASIGLSIYAEDNSTRVLLAILGFIWMMLGGFILLFFAGWVTGKLSDINLYGCGQAMLLGFVMWSIYLILSLLLLSLAQRPVMLNVIGNFADTANLVGWTGIASFFILLSGVIGSCLGACYGLKHNDKPML